MESGSLITPSEAAPKAEAPNFAGNIAAGRAGAADFGVFAPPRPVDIKGAVERMTSQPPDFNQKLGAEGRLLASLPSHIGAGVVESAKDAWEHAGRSAFEIGSGVALGAAFTLLTKNPNPLVSAAMTWTGRAFVGVAVADLGSRFARPMADVWANPGSLEANKSVLGHNVGDAVFNYSLAVGGGVAGARLGEKYLATTKLGTVLQGFKETEITAEQLAKSLGQPENKPAGIMARAFVRDGGGSAADGLPFTGSIRMRELPNGTHIGSTSDGSVMVTTADGTALSFKNTRSLFGLRNNLQLSKILHAGGDETDILTGMYGSTPTGFGRTGADLRRPHTTPHTQIIGQDPANYFEAPDAVNEGLISKSPQISSDVLRDLKSDVDQPHPVKLTTGAQGALEAVEAGGAKLFTGPGGSWQLSLGDGSAALPFRFNLQAASFDLGVIGDRYRDLKKGAEVALSEGMIERAGDIGSSIFEHQVLVRAASPGGGSEVDSNGKGTPRQTPTPAVGNGLKGALD
ncbi:MAG: hypothetical protein KGS72_26135 [Cyanobacteria bacterium REEB67]|nr:hypothetical protein [Cyanobacteria bacterium REEB67]